MQQQRELATRDNFDEERYLLANPDVAAHVRAGGNAWAHFQRHGESEARHQIAPPDGKGRSRKRERYARFAHLLDARHGAGGAFAFLDGEEAFPVHYGGAEHRIEDYETESANAGLGAFVDEVQSNPDKLYLDVGCGLRAATQDNCLYLEVYRSPSADIVMEPACLYPIASGSLDGIGCFAVLEHVPEPWTAAREFHRMLKPGGKVFIDWPFLQPVHGYPSHFYNATREGLRAMFADGFELKSIDTLGNQTPDHTITWALRVLAEALVDPVLRDDLLARPVGELIREVPGGPWWSKLIDALPPKAIETLACGNTLIAAKR